MGHSVLCSVIHCQGGSWWLQVHPQATKEDLAALFSVHGSVQHIKRFASRSEAGPHVVGYITMSNPSEAKVGIVLVLERELLLVGV